MTKKARKTLLYSFGAVASLLLVLIATVNLLLYLAPRDVSFLVPSVEEALSPTEIGYRLKIEQAFASWAGPGHPLMIQLKGVQAIDRQAEVLHIGLPEIKVTLSFLDLMQGKVQPRGLIIDGPNIWLIRSDTGEIKFGFGSEKASKLNEAATAFLARMLGLAATGDTALPQLESLQIVHARAVLSDRYYNVAWRADDVNLTLLRIPEGLKGNLSLGITYEKQEARIYGEFSVNPDANHIVAGMELVNFYPGLFSEVSPLLKLASGADLPINGWLDLQMDMRGMIEQVDFNIDAGPGSFHNEEHFAEAFQIRRLQAKGTITENLTVVEVSEGLMELDGPEIAFGGIFRYPDHQFGIEARAIARNMPLDGLYRYWPKSLYPETRGWVTGNIKKGQIPEARAQVNIKPGQLEQLPLPPEFLEATIQVEGARVDYLEGDLPVAEGVNAIVHFTGREMDMDVTSGKILDQSEITSAKIIIPDFEPTDPWLELSLALDASARDVVEYMRSPMLEYDRLLDLTPERVQGRVEGEVDIRLPLLAEKNPDKLREMLEIQVKARMEPLNVQGFLEYFDISDAEVDLSIESGKMIAAEGNGFVNKTPAIVSWKSYLSEESEYDASYSIQTVLPAARFEEFQIPDIPFLHGTVGIKAAGNRRDDKQWIHAELDLAKAVLDLREIDLTIAKDQPASATFKLFSEPGQPVKIDELRLVGEDIDIQGNAVLEPEQFTFHTLDLNTVRFGTQDMAVRYQRTPEGRAVALAGKQFDLGPFFARQQEGGIDLEAIPPFRLVAKFEKLVTGKEEHHVIRNFDARIDCGGEYCQSATIAGMLKENKGFNITIGQEEGQRTLRVRSDDAGAFLRSFDLFENINNGTIDLQGTYDDSKPERPLNGRLLIENFTLTKAPTLAKILSLTSFTGVLDLLKGDGIGFQKLGVNYTLEGNRIFMHEGKAAGSALGFTTEGWLHLKDETVEAEGVIVPAYTLNNFFSNIPVIGKALTGGEGGGVFAVNYKVEGSQEDPEVSVNPLSVLTPGFLRGLFDIFDIKEETEPTSPSPEEAAPSPSPEKVK